MLAPLTNAPRDYAWGSTTLIADLQGRAPGGGPEAEVWFGDHPGSPAIVGDGSGRTLDAVLAGGADRLPYLLKILAAASPLSIQVHPSKAQAEAGHAREDLAGVPADAAERNYRDDNHKPEVIVALGERFEALAGLRDLAATRRVLDALGAGGGELAGRLFGTAATDPAGALRATIARLLSGEAQAVVDDVIHAIRTAPDDALEAEPTADLAALRRIADAYPGDPGVVVALLMNHVALRAGEAVFVPAGVLHAYLSGLGVEIMAASDNVLRGGLTPKHIDVPELLSILDTTPGDPPRLAPVPSGDGVSVFAPGIPDFALARVALVDGAVRRIALHGPAIALATAGDVRARVASGGELAMPVGTAVFASADEGVLELTGTGEVYVAQPGPAS